MNRKIKKRAHNNKVLNLLTLIMTILAHIGVVVLIVVSFRYYSLEKTVFLSIFGLLICLLTIIDILFLVGHKFRDIGIKIINLILVLALLISSAVGYYYISKINSSIDNVIDNDGTEQYETIGGVFTYYKKNNESRNYTDLEDLKSIKNLKVGVLYDDGVGTGSLATSILEKNEIDCTISTYNNTDELLSALVGDGAGVDVAVFPASYRQRLLSDENVDYSRYLDDMVDFYSFEEKIKTGDNEKANVDLSSEPFNILLIGFAPENEAMTYGLADTIIVATINPQTFTVSMTSIARDSFVPVTCFGGNRDKINAARGNSRQCLMDTVGELLDMEINYYMEVNFLGVVQIVDAIGGIVIENNPVTFVGQSPSGIRGTYTVWVPAGDSVPLNGEQALAFARERHAMPNGDFDRQKHQQEVIYKIAEKLLALNDVNKALEVMEAAGDNMSTNLSLKQLTNIFNYLTKTGNYMGISAFNMIDIISMRVTGYASWTYNYSMRLPLWIYKLYNGSIQETKDNINDILNNYNYDELVQPGYMKFFAESQYYRGPAYSEYFNEPQEHEQLPAYYPYLTKYTYQEAIAWAQANGVTLIVTTIDEDNPAYVASEDGQIIDQSPRHGALVSEYPTGYITVMGNPDPNYVPEFTVTDCNDESSCAAFADNNDIYRTAKYIYTDDDTIVDGSFAFANYKNGETIRKDETFILYYYKYTICGENAYLNIYTGECFCNEGYEGDADTGCTLIEETPTCNYGATYENGACVCSNGGDYNNACAIDGESGGDSSGGGE